MKKLKILLIISAMVVLSGCSVIGPAVFGLREIDGYNADQCAKFYKKLPNDFAFTPIVCNDEQFFAVSNLGADSMQMKDLYQPLKIMYFHGDSLVSFHINCKCPPTLTFNLNWNYWHQLNWNYWHQFDVFPPTTTMPLDGYTLTRHDLQAIFPEIKGDGDYTVLVFWTNLLHKISRSEIRTVYRNLKRYGPSTGSGPLDDSKVEVYLINDDISMTKSLNETE